MSGSAIYRFALLYATLNRGLYGKHWREHYAAISERICDNASVLELCCGTGVLYERFLANRGITYLGLDNNDVFIERLRRREIGVRHFDVWNGSLPLGEFDYVIMQASLYQFIPDARAVVERMLHAARKEVIVSEPIRNYACSRFDWIAHVARRLSRPPAGGGEYLGGRFDSDSLNECMSDFGDLILERAVICGGRDCIYRLAAADFHAIR